MSDKSKGCWQCRMTSGGGLLAMGAYVAYQSKKVKTSSRHIITAVGYALGIIGFLRILALPPFSRSAKEEKNKFEDEEESDYIIGKIPPKFQ